MARACSLTHLHSKSTSFSFTQAEEEGVKIVLYLVTNNEISELAPPRGGGSDVVCAAWFPLRQVFDSDPEGPGALVAPFLPALHRWLDRYWQSKVPQATWHLFCLMQN